MNLDLKPLHFQNAIIKCLRIESVEYCYFIPIIFQLANYWGDVKMAYLCKIMLRQLKQHLNYVTYIHFLVSGPKKDLFLLDSLVHDLFQNRENPFINSGGLFSSQEWVDFQVYLEKLQIYNKMKGSSMEEKFRSRSDEKK